MTDTHLSATALEELLSHGSWLHGMVRGLVRDEHAADDVLQQTWLSALQRPPADRRNLRGWLGTIARHCALRQRLADARRRRHERVAAAAEALRPTDEIVVDLQVRERVLHALAGLEEPYRSTLWWRYVERRSAVEIARAQGLSASAVRSRGHRGLAHLRAALDPGPDRRGSALGLVAVALRGGLLMATATKAAAAAAVAVGLATALWWAWPTTPVHAPAPPRAALPLPPDGPPADDPAAAATTAPARSAVPEAPAAAPAAAAATLHGTVLDVAGAPVPGVAVGWSDAARAATAAAASAADGTFALPLPATSEEPATPPSIVAVGDRWTTLRAWPHRDPARTATIVVAPAVPFAGVVVDEQHRPLDRVTVRVSAVELTRFPASLEDHVARGDDSARTGSDGRFSFAAVPDTLDTRIRIEHNGYRPFDERLPAGGDRAFRVVLQRAWQDQLRGVVVDASGAVVAGASVDWGRNTLRTDAAGRFACDWPLRRASAPPLVVAARGHQPVARDYGRAAWDKEGRPDPLRIELPGPALEIAGTVRHADGRPATGYFVALRDAAMLFAHNADVTAEQIAAGTEDHKPIEATPVASDGAFTVRGLRDQAYRLVAWDPRTLVAITTAEVAAGSRGVAITIPADAMRSQLRGQVVSRSGQPLAGVEVAPVLQLLPGMGGQARIERSTVTDAEGRFTLPDVPRRGLCWIGLTGDPVIGIFHPVEEFARDEDVVLRADARCRVRFLDGAPSVGADSVLFLDENLRYVPLWSFTLGGMRPKHGIALDGTQSAEFAVSERATWLAYYTDGKQVHRRAVTLVPGQLNRIAP